MNNYKRILVIGDIHGCFKNLMSMWKKISVTPEDLVIFLGDYVDRGRENVKVLKWIMKESKKKNVVALCGNHDDMMKNRYFSRLCQHECLRHFERNSLAKFKRAAF